MAQDMNRSELCRPLAALADGLGSSRPRLPLLPCARCHGARPRAELGRCTREGVSEPACARREVGDVVRSDSVSSGIPRERCDRPRAGRVDAEARRERLPGMSRVTLDRHRPVRYLACDLRRRGLELRHDPGAPAPRHRSAARRRSGGSDQRRSEKRERTRPAQNLSPSPLFLSPAIIEVALDPCSEFLRIGRCVNRGLIASESRSAT